MNNVNKSSYPYPGDRQFVADLAAGDEQAVACLLYGRFGRLLRFNALKAASAYAPPGSAAVTPDDLIQEFYLHLSADGWARLRHYDPAQPFATWLSVVSYRFFRDYSRRVIDSARQIPISDIEDRRLLNAGTAQMSAVMMDIRDGLARLEPPRDREVLTALLLRDEEPQRVADRLGVTVDNLYNIKRRAIARLIAQHLNEYRQQPNNDPTRQ